jgi:L-threonylcarbamoyladenylate synthase
MTFPLTRVDLRADPDADLETTVRHLRADGVIAYPTETVYGFGSTLSSKGIAAVKNLKSRGEEKPIIVLIGAMEQVAGLVWTDAARELAKIFWPGAVTLVLADPQGVFPKGVHNQDGGVAVRLSPQPVVRRLIAALDGPLTSTSVNGPGERPARSGSEAADVIRRMGRSDVHVLDAGTLPHSLSSTIIDCTGVTPTVLREGSVPVGRLRCAIPEIHGQDS